MSGGLITRLTDFLAKPFNTDGDVTDWVLFTILIVSVAVLWCRVLAHVEPID